MAAARNAGIRQARGRLICCIDPDDCYAPDYLEKAASALDSDPEAGIVATPYELFDEERGLVRAERCNFPEMLVENQIMVAAMFRREGWEKAGGYDESLPSMQDWEFWINVLEQGYRAVALPEVGFYYRVRADLMYQTTRQPERFSASTASMCASTATPTWPGLRKSPAFRPGSSLTWPAKLTG